MLAHGGLLKCIHHDEDKNVLQVFLQLLELIGALVTIHLC